MKVLIWLRGCTGWSAPLLFAYGKTGFLMMWLILFSVPVLYLGHHVEFECIGSWPLPCHLLPNTFILLDDIQNRVYIWHTKAPFKRATSWQNQKITVRPAKAQISLDFRPVWSESSLFAWRKLGSLATHWAHSEDSDQTGQMHRLTRVFAGRTVILLVLSRGGSNLDYVKSHRYERVNDITVNLTSFWEIISKTRLPWGPITWLQLALQINGLHHVIDSLKAIGQ